MALKEIMWHAESLAGVGQVYIQLASDTYLLQWTMYGASAYHETH